MYIERDNYFPLLDAQNADSTLLFINLITSHLRSCRFLSAKMDAIILLLKFSKILPGVVADRIIPYLVKNFFYTPLIFN